MMFAFSSHADRLVRLESPAELTRAIWIDLYRPMPQQVAAVEELGVEVPTLADMEEIEISNRLYRDEGNEYMTVVLPGLSETRAPTSGPVTFILSPERMITVRHHAPRPFETFPDRAYRTGAGCESPERLFLGLMEEIIGRLADLLESTGRSLDTLAATVYRSVETNGRTDQLQLALEQAGQQGELIGRVRLSLLTLERAISYFGQTLGNREPDKLRPIVKGLMRDITALEVHADFLSQRVALATDSTLGMINLAQNMTVRIVSVVAALFLPPTLIASIYGMNFEVMPELQWVAGYPFALALMLASAIGTYLFFRWRRWL
jgi:magnesium transporter